MNLTIDIGNTRAKIGLFKNRQLIQKWVWKEALQERLDSLFRNHTIKNIICSSVRTTDTILISRLKSRGFFVNLTADTPLPIQNGYETPHTLGKDRIAAAVGAFDIFPDTPCLVIDAGTCITYDVVDAAGKYLGGNITPGLRMRFRAMQHFTEQLPLVKTPSVFRTTIGKSTEEAIQVGGSLGNILEMEGWIQHFQGLFPGINTTLTGGDADYFANRLKSKIFVDANLVLIGLNKILNYNVERF